MAEIRARKLAFGKVRVLARRGCEEFVSKSQGWRHVVPQL